MVARIEQGARLLTLTGPGGSGKTRLALEAASIMVPKYRAGVFWVGLAALRDPSLVIEQIAQTLGAKDELAAHIGEREMLLLIDNLEQVVEAAPELSRLLRGLSEPQPPLHEPRAPARAGRGRIRGASTRLAARPSRCSVSARASSRATRSPCSAPESTTCLSPSSSQPRAPKRSPRRRSSTASRPASTCSRAGGTLILASRRSGPPSAGATTSFGRRAAPLPDALGLRRRLHAAKLRRRSPTPHSTPCSRS